MRKGEQGQGLNLLSFTNKEGQTTHYTYDGAGRKIQEQTADQITSYTYDALDRLSTTCRHNGPNTLWIEKKRDLLDQLVELRKTDGAGNILYQVAYTYDPAGNIQSVTRTIQGEEAKETFCYDSCNRLIETIDALGYVTKTHYDEQRVNPLGQRILTKITLDPQGVSTLVTHDAHSRPVKEELVKGAQKLACREMILDPSGNTLAHHEHVYLNGQAQRVLTTCFSYTPLNKVESITRAANTPNARTTRYTYTPTGKLASKTQPDGTLLSTTYDALGYRQSYRSSDGSVNLTYVHNRLGQLVQAFDENQGFSIQRRLDAHGNVVSEQFLNGLVIEKTYDHLNRPLALSLPDQGRVEYGYDPTTLRTVTRYSPNGTQVYTHQYLEYDLSGHLITSLNPWRYASKRTDSGLNLVYYGQRYYDPQLARWLTTDPAGFIDSFNLYQYVFNNPFRYQDPRGESIGGFLFGIGQILLGGVIMATGAVLEVATFGGYTFALGFHESAGLALITSGCAQAMYSAKDISFIGRSYGQSRDGYSNTFSKRHTPDQEAMSEFVKEYERKGVSNAEADTLLDWAKECDFPNRDDRGKPPHWEGGEHIHLGPEHIPVRN